jgi:hypothetical protein
MAIKVYKIMVPLQVPGHSGLMAGRMGRLAGACISPDLAKVIDLPKKITAPKTSCLQGGE